MPNDIESLCSAATKGDLVTLMALLDEDGGLIHQKHEGATALHFAALEGRDEAVGFLLDRGADLDVCDEEFGSPPAGWANEKGHDATVQLLFRRGAIASAYQAAAWGLRDRLEEIFEDEAEAIDEPNAFGTPLHGAVIFGRTEIVIRLLEMGANPGLPNRDGLTALDLAVAQAKNARQHASIVSEARRAEIEKSCAQIAGLFGA